MRFDDDNGGGGGSGGIELNLTLSGRPITLADWDEVDAIRARLTALAAGRTEPAVGRMGPVTGSKVAPYTTGKRGEAGVGESEEEEVRLRYKQGTKGVRDGARRAGKGRYTVGKKSEVGARQSTEAKEQGSFMKRFVALAMDVTARPAGRVGELLPGKLSNASSLEPRLVPRSAIKTRTMLPSK